jgi:hypothetical protein
MSHPDQGRLNECQCRQSTSRIRSHRSASHPTQPFAAAHERPLRNNGAARLRGRHWRVAEQAVLAESGMAAFPFEAAKQEIASVSMRGSRNAICGRGEACQRMAGQSIDASRAAGELLEHQAVCRRTVSRYSTSHPAFLRLFLKLVVGFARDNKLSATWRTMAIFSGALPLRNPSEINARGQEQYFAKVVLASAGN